MNTSEQYNNLQQTTGNAILTNNNSNYELLIKHLEENPLPLKVHDLPKDSTNPEIPSNKKYIFALPENLTNPEGIARNIDELLDSDENVAYDFTYYDCGWTVIVIKENGEYNAFYIRLYKQSNPDVRYYISIQDVASKSYSYYFKDFCDLVESFFDKTKTIGRPNMIFEGLPNFGLEFGLEFGLKSEEYDVKAIIDKAFDNIEHPEPTDNKFIYPYRIDEFVIKPLVDSSVNSVAKEYFTSDRLSVLLEFWKSIEEYDDLLLTSTRCAIIIYNILTENILDDVTQLIDYCLKIAKKEGNLWDEHLRLKACQIIKIIVNKECNITDEKKNEMNEFLEWLVEKNHKFIKKLSLN